MATVDAVRLFLLMHTDLRICVKRQPEAIRAGDTHTAQGHRTESLKRHTRLSVMPVKYAMVCLIKAIQIDAGSPFLYFERSKLTWIQ